MFEISEMADERK